MSPASRLTPAPPPRTVVRALALHRRAGSGPAETGRIGPAPPRSGGSPLRVSTLLLVVARLTWAAAATDGDQGDPRTGRPKLGRIFCMYLLTILIGCPASAQDAGKGATSCCILDPDGGPDPAGGGQARRRVGRRRRGVFAVPRRHREAAAVGSRGRAGGAGGGESAADDAGPSGSGPGARPGTLRQHQTRRPAVLTRPPGRMPPRASSVSIPIR